MPRLVWGLMGCSLFVLGSTVAANAFEAGGADDGNGGSATTNVAIGAEWNQISSGVTNAVSIGWGAAVQADTNGGGDVNGGIAIGSDAKIGAPGSILSTHDSVAIGASAQVNEGSYSSVSYGGSAVVGTNAHESTAIGQGANIGAGAYGSTALGHAASVSANADESVAIGDWSKATYANSVAIGFQSQTTRGAESYYSAFGLSDPQNSIGEVAVGTLTGARTITGVAAGHEDTDAVNVAQLSAVSTNVASIFGGGAALDVNGVITAPDYVVQGNTYNDVGSAFSAIDSSLTDLGGQITEKAGQAGAVGLATSSLRFDDRPGKVSVALGAGSWSGQGAFAFGGGYTSTDQRIRTNLSGATSGGQWGASAGVSFTLN
ncbi:MAG TPA: YadA-like family protein [Bauldia sp.]|nr:YadA-like family protein [Bauldia sp.]